MSRIFCFLVMSGCLCFMLSASEVHHNFFSAAKVADSFLIVEVNGKRQTMSKYMLPREADAPYGSQMDESFAPLEAGTYVFPVKSGEVLKFPFAAVRVENPENIYSLLLRFRQLRTEDENYFLMGNLLKHQQDMRFAALKRLQENGLFEAPFAKNTSLFFKDFYTKTNLSVPERRLLLEEFSRCNFNQMTEVYILALSDRNMAKLAGRIFYEKKRSLFTDIVKEHISNEKLWMTALRQSEYFADDGDFIDRAMKRFNRENPLANSPDFIPLLFSTARNVPGNEYIIRKLLTDSRNTKHFELFRVLSYWLNRRKADAFKNEIMQFLVNNQGNHYITDSMIYPTMLSALKNAGHPQADRLLLEYLEELKVRNDRQMTNQVCILFKKENLPNPTLDSLIGSLKQSF